MRNFAKAAAVALGLGVVIFAAPVWSAGEPDTSATDAETSDSVDTDTVAKGRAIIEANCARCHAIGMEDSSHHEEAPPFRVVVTRYPPEDLAEALAEGIVSGHPDMPEFVFQPAEIEAILAYLGTLMPAPQDVPEKK
jgi:mono/diheme cytochrome c family protein